jgi:hypothetical protein
MTKTRLIDEIKENKNLGEFSWNEIYKRFTELNDSNPKAVEFALVDFDYSVLSENFRKSNQRYWTIDSWQKVFNPNMCGTSLYSYCIGDGLMDGMRELFNSKNVINVYLITKEDFYKLIGKELAI